MSHSMSAGTVSLRELSTGVGKGEPIGASSPSAPIDPLPHRTGATLSREILAWLQSLQLNSSVKYPKRDLANGYVIAHICARYWPHVPLHSFENKMGTANKQSNWFMLRKVFRQRGVDVSATMVDGMINGVDDCASAFLEQLYTVLTGKHVDAEAVPLKEPLTEVPVSKVPLFVPTSNGSIAARMRYGDGATDHNSLTKVFPSNNFAGARENATSFGAAATVSGVSDGRGKDTRPTVAVQLPALSIPTNTTPGPGSVPAAKEMASTMPMLSVLVRSADQVSTVLPAQQLLASATVNNGDDGTLAHPRIVDSSLAGVWFCTKVRNLVPADALEALAEGDQAAATPTALLQSTLRWLSGHPHDGGDEGTPKKAQSEDANENKENPHQAGLRMNVWQGIASAMPELVQILLQQGGHGFDILVDSLFAFVDAAQSRLSGDQKRCIDDDTHILFVSSALHFSTLFLASLSDVNVHHAVACLEIYFAASPNFAQALRGIQWTSATDYAELITSVLPTNRRHASRMLKSLWGTIKCIVLDSATEEISHYGDDSAGAGGDGERSVAGGEEKAEVCLLVLLRALLISLLGMDMSTSSNVRLGQSKGSRAQREASGRTTSSSVRRTAQRSHKGASVTGLGWQDAVRSTIVQLAAQHSTAALQRTSVSHSSVTGLEIDEAAVALAVQVLCINQHPSLVTEYVVGTPFFDVYNALFPLSTGDETPATATTPSPTLAVLRARWVRYCLQRRFELGMSCHSQTAAAALSSTTSTQHPPNTSKTTVSFEGLGGGDHPSTTATSVQSYEVWIESYEMNALLNGVQKLSQDLSSAPAQTLPPAEAQSRVLVACALVESLPFLPAKYKTEGASPANAWMLSASPRQPHCATPLTVAATSSSSEVDAASGSERHSQQNSSVGGSIFAESTAAAALRVLVYETTPAQIPFIIGSPPELGVDAAAKEDGETESESPWSKHQCIGPLKPSGWLVEHSDPLLLVKAALAVLGSGMKVKHPVPVAGERDPRSAGALRRLSARTAMLARDGQVEEKVSRRVVWLSRILVEGRNGGVALFPRRCAGEGSTGRRPISSGREETVAATCEAADTIVHQWRTLLSYCYEDLVVIAQAASLRLRQRGGGTSSGGSVTSGPAGSGKTAASTSMLQFSEAIGEELSMLARKADGVLCCLWREVAPVVGSSPASGVKNETALSAASSSPVAFGPLFSFLDGVTQEELVAAVGWIFAVGSA